MQEIILREFKTFVIKGVRMKINNTQSRQNSPEFKGFVTVLVDTSKEGHDVLSNTVLNQIKRGCRARLIPFNIGSTNYAKSPSRTPIVIGRTDTKIFSRYKGNKANLFVRKKACVISVEDLLDAIKGNKFDFEEGKILDKPEEHPSLAAAKVLWKNVSIITSNFISFMGSLIKDSPK